MLIFKNTPLFPFSGNKVMLEKLLHTQLPIVINFWATWCAPCVAEMPALDSVSNLMKDKVDFYTISINKDKNAWKNF